MLDGPPVDFDPQMATVKPKDFLVNIQPRTDMPAANTSTTTATKTQDASSSAHPATKVSIPQVDINASRTTDVKLPPITFLYGSQTGTAQDYAAQLASQARGFGFDKVTFCEMDKWNVLETGKYNPSSSGDQELVVISTATYNGQPPDCAERFNAFINDKTKQEGNEDLLKGLQFTVFGVGNKNWRTYQAFPRKVNEGLDQLGAERFFSCGEGNADKDIDADFNEW